MKLPLSLLQSHLPLKGRTPAEIAHALTHLGIEVEKIEGELPPFSGVVAAEVREVARHPGAEKLQIATVFDGKETHSIVCGAPNCRAGIKTAFAKVGAKLGGRTIEPAKIRGIESAGMLCSGEELSISSEGDGILELPSDLATGSDLLPLLWNPVFEISLTPNLGHCLNALGIARELSASFEEPLSLSPTPSATAGDPHLRVSLDDPKGCPLYTCRLIENATIAPSPFWLQQELKQCGLTPISNAVDALNWIMMKWGQPLHAFDADQLELKNLRVAKATQSETVSCLDGTMREVPPGTLLIWSGKTPVAIAGILGGMKSSITANTKRILLESALFDPAIVRTSAKKMGIRTESSQRFEKGVDPEGVESALHRATLLVAELTGGTPSPSFAVAKGELPPRRTLSCRVARVEKILGHHFSLSELQRLFERLGCATQPHGSDLLRVEIPSYRLDLQEEIDLIEEVARLYGYNHLKRSPPYYQSAPLPPDPEYALTQKVRQAFLRLGLQEVLHCDLIGPKLARLSKEIAPPELTPLTTVYSKSEEHSTLRTTLLPALLETVARNTAQKNRSLALFELGRIHFLQGDKPTERPMAALLLTGPSHPLHWTHKPKEWDFFDLKGKLEELFSLLHLPGYHFSPSSHPSLHPGRQAFLSFGDLRLGSLGEVHPHLLSAFDLETPVLFAELDLAPLISLLPKEELMKPLPQFPSSERDWTLPLSERLSLAPLLERLRAAASPLLEKIEVIDLYQKEGSPERHITLRFTYRDLTKTLSFEQVEAEHSRLLASLNGF